MFRGALSWEIVQAPSAGALRQPIMPCAPTSSAEQI